MTAIGGARDTLLQATAERFSTTADGKAILLAGSTPVFRVNSAGASAPGSIAITAKPVNVVGDIVWAPGLDGALLLSTRGGDYALHLGQDLSIGYLSHDADSIELYHQETLTFLVYTSEASVAIR